MRDAYPKYNLFFAVLMTILLSASPMLMLFEHHQWADVVDKFLLILTAFLTAYANLSFQNGFLGKSFSLFKLLMLSVLLNLVLLGVCMLIRVPFWYLAQNHRPPVFILVALDGVRSILIAVISYFIVIFFAKNKLYEQNNLKIKALENQSLQLQIKNLTAQLQPHFFFNSLNVLSELIRIDLKKSDEYIQQLSHFFRYVLSTQQNPFVALQEEIQFINTYLYLLKIRFEDAISVHFSIQNHEQYSIPSLCTLIVLENIIKHNNIIGMKIDITILEQESFFKINHTKNKKKSIDINYLGYGLENINKKSEILLQKNIRVIETEHTFEVQIPIIETVKI